MCTTALLLGTLVMILRRRFSNRVEPYAVAGSRWEGTCCSPASRQ
uniref:Uncharacterized protein n=1 Tax=Strigops habroptila TaxID=2489341 RepID=A0A672UJF8_STRHB